MKRRFNVLNIVSAILTLLAHVLFIYLISVAWKYMDLDRTAVLSVVGIAICSLIILDLFFMVGAGYKTKKISTIACAIAAVLMVVGAVGTVVVAQVDQSINKVVDSEDDAQYETIRVVYATYDNNSITELKDANGKKVGSLKTIGISAASVGKQKMVDDGINANFSEFDTTSDLYNALVAGDIDMAIFPNVYRTQLSGDGYDDLLEKTVNVFEYEEKVKTNDETASKKDLSTDPFTVLLIGYAPEAGGGGLTDTIILASINPNTMQVSMTSIARDSYVPIACYGNSRSKINDAGAASNACLMDTVEQLMDVDVDFYMKVNFQGLVDIVDALGGIYINSPVEFTGQSSSSTRGEYNVWVPAGEYVANGEQALAFARERHAMPNGDFDRQIHQQQVISSIASKLIELNDISKALKILEVAGDNFSTNLSVSQLTKVFNYLITAPNYSGTWRSNLVDIKMSRLTGYTYWFYSYSARLPLWSYYLYDGSIKQNVALSKDVLGDYKPSDIKQDKQMKIFVNMPYIRDEIYSLSFNEAHVPEDMPAYYPKLTGYSLDQALSWASSNGVSINWNTINEGDPGYSASAVGRITDQYPRYGALVSEYPSCTLTIIGSPISEADRVPNFVGGTIGAAKNWCGDNGIGYNPVAKENSDPAKAGIVISQSVASGSNKNNVGSITFEYYGAAAVDASGSIGKNENDLKAWCKSKGIGNYKIQEATSGSPCGSVVDVSPKSGTTDTAFVFYIAPHLYAESSRVEPTCSAAGKIVYKCATCSKSYEKEIPMIDHKLVQSERVEPTCSAAGKVVYKCSVCGKTVTEELAKIAHNWVEIEGGTSPTCTTAGSRVLKCSSCDATTTEEIPATGHSYGEWSACDGSHTRLCTVCQVEQTETCEIATPVVEPNE